MYQHLCIATALTILLWGPAFSWAAGVYVCFDLDAPTTSPFSSDVFTAPGSGHNTGLRMNLPKPDCAVRVSDCQNIDVINTLDGFNLQPRLSIPFTGPINVSTATSATIFLLNLGSTLERDCRKAKGWNGDRRDQGDDHRQWVTQAGNSVAYAPHLRKSPLAGMSPKDIIIHFAKGDMTVPNPTATALLRAGDLAGRATYYRNDLAFADPLRNPTGVQVPKDPHAFIIFNSISPLLAPAVADIGAGARQQIAEFFASDGENVIDPDGTGLLFEVPIVGPLPEELNFIP